MSFDGFNMSLAKSSASIFFVVLLGVLLAAPCKAQEVGSRAPPLSARTLDGEVFNLADAIGKVVIINFWASWCSPCRKEMPALDSYYKKHKSEGLLVLAINIDEQKNAQLVREIMSGFSFPAAFSQDAQYAGYGRIWRLPMTFVIDRNGILRKDGSVGNPKIDLPLLEALVTPLLNNTKTPQS